MKKSSEPPFLHKYKFPLIAAAALLFLALALWSLSWKPSPDKPSLLEKELAKVIPLPTPAPLPKPPALGVEPLDRSVQWTAYYITPAKKAPEGTGKTLIVEANDGKKYRYNVTTASYRAGEIEAVAEGIDKNGRKRFGYRISSGVWKELPEGSMGMGNKLNALVPLHHIAADQRRYPYGSMVYLAAADGLKTVDGKILDGYFWVADTGGAIVGNHIDLFVGEEFRYLNFTKADYQSRFPTKIYPLPRAPKKLNPLTNPGLAEILYRKNFLKEPGVPADTILREAVVAYQQSEPRIHPAEYGDPDAATTLWFLTQAALELDAKDKAEAEAREDSEKSETPEKKSGEKSKPAAEEKTEADPKPKAGPKKKPSS